MNAELKVRNVVAQICVLVRDHTELIQCKKKAAAGRDNFHFSVIPFAPTTDKMDSIFVCAVNSFCLSSLSQRIHHFLVNCPFDAGYCTEGHASCSYLV